MIELQRDQLVVSFPDVHEDAWCAIDFQRTLRIPDDNQPYPLPPGLGNFPMKHVEDYADTLPELWQQHGGVFLPMYQSEALWIKFSGRYPCAIKIAAGKINAVTGDAWSDELRQSPQDYMVVPGQPWLDGFNVREGYVRQFVAMPLGLGYSAEEQITGDAEHGGLQVVAYPMRADAYQEYIERLNRKARSQTRSCMHESFSLNSSICEDASMGLAPGGLMRQEIYEDNFGIDAWDQSQGSRCFVHLANSDMYQTITNEKPPHQPANAQHYNNAGLPWFDYYSEKPALPGSKKLGGLTSVAATAIAKGKGFLFGNDTLTPKQVKKLGNKGVVKEGKF